MPTYSDGWSRYLPAVTNFFHGTKNMRTLVRIYQFASRLISSWRLVGWEYWIFSSHFWSVSCSNVNTFQVVFLMYLWSIDTEAVYTSISCFSLLCEEADIRCTSDEVTVASLLPNYAVYQELSQTSTYNISEYFDAVL